MNDQDRVEAGKAPDVRGQIEARAMRTRTRKAGGKRS
jgi:hypothetical protein